MAITSLLTQVQDTLVGRKRLAACLDLAARFKAQLIGVGVQAFAPYVNGSGAFGFVDGAAIQAIRDEIDREISLAQTLFEAETARTGVVGTWRSSLGDPCDMIAHAARAADMIVASRHDKTAGPGFTAFASDLVIASGRPVLVTPQDCQTLALQNALICWKDSREARRALSDALPLLAQSDQVTVMEIADADGHDEARFRTDSVVGFLAGHGISAKAEVARKRQGRVSETILAEAKRCGADYLVLGGYAHARLREWVLGGVTQDIIDATPIPALLSH